MTTNHVDQLAQWYADAERITDTNLPRAGDTLIFPYNADGYAIEAEGDDWTPGDVVPGEPVRILSRAPKSRHPFPAILATYRDENGMVSGVWRPEGKPRYWEGPEGDVIAEEALEDVTPLIPAKVTDEARERVWRSIQRYTGEDDRHRPDYGAEIDGYITAALGLETT